MGIGAFGGGEKEEEELLFDYGARWANGKTQNYLDFPSQYDNYEFILKTFGCHSGRCYP